MFLGLVWLDINYACSIGKHSEIIEKYSTKNTTNI